MKKVIAILLILSMAFLLFACGNGKPDGSAPPSSQSPVSQSPASQSPASQSPASQSPATQSPATQTPISSDEERYVAPTGEADSAGYVSDDVDHWARRSYNIVYYNHTVTALTAQSTDALNLLGDTYNFTVESLTANGDTDAFFSNLTTILLKKPDGLVVDINPELAPRVADITNEYDIPSVCLFSAATSVDGVCLIPSVILDQFYNGQRQIEYLESVYRDYWGDIDPSEIVLLIVGRTSNRDFVIRQEGALDKWKEFFGDQMYYEVDTASETMSPEGGYNVSNSLLSVHPEVKYWFVMSPLEDLVLGASRAAEALGIDDRVLMTSSGASVLPAEWDAGYDGCWIANYAVSPFYYSGTAIFGLLALIDGRATTATLWPEYFLEGDEAARFSLKADMMTKENYKQYLGDVVRSFGVEYDG